MLDDEALLLAYSEWLDSEQHLLTCPADDRRSHEDLVNEFLAEHAERLARQ